MIMVLPFEIVTRNCKSLLISYLSSVDLHHEGMKKVLSTLHQKRGPVTEDALLSLLSVHGIDAGEGEAFLIANGIIKKIDATKSALWKNVVIVTDNKALFSFAINDWVRDGICIDGVYSPDNLPSKIPDDSLIWIHLETYSTDIIRRVYCDYLRVENVAFIQSYYLKELLRFDGVYSPHLGTPCHFCHIERWLNREEKSFRRNETSWANLLTLLKTHSIGLPAIALSRTERGFTLHMIKRRLQELTGNSLVKSHVDTLMSSVSTDLITCVLNREPVIHWHACDCTEQ